MEELKCNQIIYREDFAKDKGMSDLISRQAAIAYSISGMTREIDGDKWIRVSEVRESIKTMPSAQPEPSVQPEIIRCKDCKNWQTDWTPIFSNFTPEDHFCSLVDLVTEDDFFCGYAERKEEHGKSN